MWPRYAGAVAAFDSDAYRNELGVEAMAHRLEDIEAHLDNLGFRLVQWYGIRVFNDGVPGDMMVAPDEDWDTLIEAEWRAGCTDPYRWFGSQLHVIARRA